MCNNYFGNWENLFWMFKNSFGKWEDLFGRCKIILGGAKIILACGKIYLGGAKLIILGQKGVPKLVSHVGSRMTFYIFRCRMLYGKALPRNSIYSYNCCKNVQ